MTPLLLLLCGAASAGTLTVGTSDDADLSDLQLAIYLSADGDVIYIEPGVYEVGTVYTEGGLTHASLLRLDRSVAIVGAGPDEVFVQPSFEAGAARVDALHLDLGALEAEVHGVSFLLDVAGAEGGTYATAAIGTGYDGYDRVEGSLLLQRSVFHLPGTHERTVFYGNSDRLDLRLHNVTVDFGTEAPGSVAYLNRLSPGSEVRNSILAHTDCSARLSSDASVSTGLPLSWTNTWGCTAAPEGEGNLAEDPGFVDWEGADLGLDEDSAMIDAGDPEPAWNDPDGSRNDLGATGGPDVAPTPGWDGIPELAEQDTGWAEDGPTRIEGRGCLCIGTSFEGVVIPGLIWGLRRRRRRAAQDGDRSPEA